MKKPLLFGIILAVYVVIVAFVFAQFYPEGMISYWKFDEGSGKTASDSVAANDGTLLPSLPGPTWTPGLIGNALSFDGIDDYVDCGNDASLDINEDITLEVWVYPTGLTSTSEGIVGFYETPSQDGYEIGFNFAGEGAYIRFYLDDANYLKSSTPLSLNTWTHVVGTYDGFYLKVYLNGSENISIPYSGGISPKLTLSSLAIGRWYGNYHGYYFKGLIDEVAIYNRTLTQEEIQQHYNNGLAGTEITPDANTVGLWHFNNSIGTTATDSSIFGNHGTLLSNSPTWKTGIVGDALSFDGIDDYVDCGNDASLDINEDITLEAWVYPTGLTSTSEGIVGFKEAPSQNGYEIGFNFAGEGAYIRFYRDDAIHLKSSTPLSLNTWTHVVGTYDGSYLKVYLNGSLNNFILYSGGISPTLTLSSLTIGRWYGNYHGYYFKGLIDEVAIYNRALTQEEIQWHYEDGLIGLGYRETTIDINIDIKPGSFPNTINLGSKGNVPVAIFSTTVFDATTIDSTTVTLAGASVKLKGKGTPMASFEDVNGDGLRDIIVHVDTAALELSMGDTDAVLGGETYDGKKIRGTDTIRVIE